MGRKLRDVYDLETMLLYCSEKLQWPIDIEHFEDLDDVFFDYSPDDVGIKDEYFSKISSLKQLRPLIEHQPWGVFSVEFIGDKFETAVLKKIIAGLIRRSRTGINKIWDYDKLLFICFWGAEEQRTIAFVAAAIGNSSLPIIKSVYCAPKLEAPSYLEDFESRISALTWPSDSNKNWVAEWSKIFAREKKEVIRNSTFLTEKLAEKAANIATMLHRKIEIEGKSGTTYALFERFRNALHTNFTESNFIDMYAQTIVYGLFSARCMASDKTDFSLESSVEYIPKTNPLLRELFHEYCASSNAASYDELQIYEIVDLLTHTDIEAIISDFNRQTGYGKEDPIVYFYEKFLDIYEHEEKKRMGVYYTPVPAVNFIVRSISHLLENKFACKNSYLDERVSILDPAAGTGTFLRSIILEAYAKYKKNHGLKGWSDYLSNNFLSRLFGVELMMAPYAIAHMKIALTMQDTGFSPTGTERLRIYLANTLENPEATKLQLRSEDPLVLESVGLLEVHQKRINVILGNPPYRSDSKNQGDWIMNLMSDYKKEPGLAQKLNEKNSKVVNDDYVKFIRFAQEIISHESNAIIGYVLAHSFIDNVTFRGVRWNLLKNFDEIYILNLHGNALSGEAQQSSNTRDENIFDIQQGVCICFLVRTEEHSESLAKVFYSELYGSREEKYNFLSRTEINKIDWSEVTPEAPYYFFKNKQLDNKDEYYRGIQLAKLFPTNIGGIKTHHDEVLISSSPFATEDNQLYAYRPYDLRYINYDRKQVERNRFEVMCHFIGHDNLGLVIDRQVVTDNWSHISIVRYLVDNRFHFSRKGIPIVCPMYLYDEDGERRPNLDPELAELFNANLSGYIADISEIFDYSYGILHSYLYRGKYKGLLSIEFPRVPIPASLEMFKEMNTLGSELRKLHLMDEPIENRLGVEFCGAGDNIVTSPFYKQGLYYINKKQYFTNIPSLAVDFPQGGYHGLKKWLKDRKNIKLTDSDIAHMVSVWNIIMKTDELMRTADTILQKYNMV